MVYRKKGTLENPLIDWNVLLTFLNANAGNTRELSIPSLLVPVSPTPAQRKRAEKLIGMIQEFEFTEGAEARALENSINAELARYPLHYALQKTEGGFAVGLQAPRKGFKATERHIVAMLVELVRMGLLSLLRKCEWKNCERWFLALRKDQKFHAAPCKRKHEASSDEFKTHRAQYMRERYRSLMEPKNRKRATKGRR